MQNIKNTYSGFTLIELMIVITIVWIISLATYLPYAHHQKKVAIKQAAREISQSLSQARNLAIHGLDVWDGNVNVALYFASWATQIDYYTSTGALNIGALPSDTYRQKQLPQWVQVDSIGGIGGERLFVFDSISGSGSISGEIVPDEVEIQISYQWATNSILQRVIKYYRKSYISDY